jgi:hypothetical protein
MNNEPKSDNNAQVPRATSYPTKEGKGLFQCQDEARQAAEISLRQSGFSEEYSNMILNSNFFNNRD